MSFQDHLEAREKFRKMSEGSENGTACGSFGRHSGPLNWTLYGGTICERHARIALSKQMPVLNPEGKAVTEI